MDLSLRLGGFITPSSSAHASHPIPQLCGGINLFPDSIWIFFLPFLHHNLCCEWGAPADAMQVSHLFQFNLYASVKASTWKQVFQKWSLEYQWSLFGGVKNEYSSDGIEKIRIAYLSGMGVEKILLFIFVRVKIQLMFSFWFVSICFAF